MEVKVIYRTKCPTLAGLNKEEEIIADYQNGLPMLQLEHKYNVHRQALKRILLRNGVVLKTRKEIRNSEHYVSAFNKREYKICAPEIQEDIVKMYLNHDSPEIIAKKYNVTPKAVRKHLKKYNIHIRSASESAQNEKAKARKEQTCIERYGVRNPLQDADIHSRMLDSALRYKTCVVNNIEFKNVQGYEPHALKYLVESLHIKATDIIAGRINELPSISYIFKNRTHVYFPDIYIPCSNLLIEVKSEYTFNADREKNLAKQAAAKQLGYNHQILIFDQFGKLLSTI